MARPLPTPAASRAVPPDGSPIQPLEPVSEWTEKCNRRSSKYRLTFRGVRHPPDSFWTQMASMTGAREW
jgi:hypothetical protein